MVPAGETRRKRCGLVRFQLLTSGCPQGGPATEAGRQKFAAGDRKREEARFTLGKYHRGRVGLRMERYPRNHANAAGTSPGRAGEKSGR